MSYAIFRDLIVLSIMPWIVDRVSVLRIGPRDFSSDLLIVAEDGAAILGAHAKLPRQMIGIGLDEFRFRFACSTITDEPCLKRHFDLQPLHPDAAQSLISLKHFLLKAHSHLAE